MKQRIFLTIIGILLLGKYVLSQENKVIPDERLYELWGKTYVDSLVKVNPELIRYYNFYLDNSYFISELKQDKLVEGIDIHTVEVKEGENAGIERFSEKSFDRKKFNPLRYNFVQHNSVHTTYIFKEAGIAINFYPIDKFAIMYKEYVNNLKK